MIHPALQHVDKLSTHAASIIVNIAQLGVAEPWPLEIFDHAGRMHDVVMAPGDILFYESAKNIHSRVRPFDGGRFVNIFAHYRPMIIDPDPESNTGSLIGDEHWYLKEQPPGTVKAATIIPENIDLADPASTAAARAVTIELTKDGGKCGGRNNVYLSEEQLNHHDIDHHFELWLKYTNNDKSYGDIEDKSTYGTGKDRLIDSVHLERLHRLGYGDVYERADHVGNVWGQPMQ